MKEYKIIKAARRRFGFWMLTCVATPLILAIWLLDDMPFFWNMVIYAVAIAIEIGVLFACLLWARRTRRKVESGEICSKCGYSLEGHTGVGVCPECGEPFLKRVGFPARGSGLSQDSFDSARS